MPSASASQPYDFANARIAFVTMGCAKNEVDSADMAQRLAAAGFTVGVEPDDADVVIVNTCSFIQDATEESIAAVLDACDLDRVKEGNAGLIVAGCMPARYKDDLAEALPEVRSFVPCAEEDNIVERVDDLLKSLSINTHTLESVNATALDHDSEQDALIEISLVQQEEPFAYVKISDGCDRFCSYCTIPYIRGRYHSFAYEQIKGDVERAQLTGAREIVLIAQDTGKWGTDFSEPSSLAELVENLASDFPNLWFRLMYIQPEGITDELIDVVARFDNICSYFDIPFQQVSPTLLRCMNRQGSAAEYLELINKIRTHIPNVALRTTLMVGFPGETEEEFELLKYFVEEAELDYVGMFAYSREEGTRADRLPDQIDEDVKFERLQELRNVADTVSATVISKRIGRTVDVLVCGQEEDGQWFGRTQSQAPDVDGLTYFDPELAMQSGISFEGRGDVISLLIEDTLLYEMEGSLVDER